MTLPDIISTAFQLYVHNPFTFLALALPKAALVLALTLGNLAVFDALGVNNSASSETNVGTATLLATALAIASIATLSIASDAFGDSFIVPAALEAAQGKVVKVRLAVAAWRPLAGTALVASLLIGLRVAVTALTILLVPVAIFLYVRWSLAIPALFAERTRGSGSLRRSAELVSGTWWRVFGITVAVGALTLAPQAALQRAFDGGDAVLSAAIVFVAAWLVAPFAAIARTLLYLDVLMRKGASIQPPNTLAS
jgi:hypothetical protein